MAKRENEGTKEKKQKKERKGKRKQYRGLYLNPISVPRARTRACEGRRLACTCTFAEAGEAAMEIIGREITFKVEGRCGDPEAGTQTKSIEAILDKGADGPKITRVVCEGHEDTPDTLFDGGAVKIEGTGLAGATECTFTCQDMSGSEHQGAFVHTDPDFTASDTLVTIDAISIVGNMREKCGQAGSSLDLTVGATIKLTLSDGTELTHHVFFVK